MFSRFRPSGVFAFRPTQSPARPSSSATRRANCRGVGTDLRASQNQTGIQVGDAYPASCTRFRASRKKMTESAPFHLGSDGGNRAPISGAAMAPSRASVMACSRTSPSECPPRPLSCGRVIPPIFRGMPGEFVRVEAVADAGGGSWVVGLWHYGSVDPRKSCVELISR